MEDEWGGLSPSNHLYCCSALRPKAVNHYSAGSPETGRASLQWRFLKDPAVCTTWDILYYKWCDYLQGFFQLNFKSQHRTAVHVVRWGHPPPSQLSLIDYTACNTICEWGESSRSQEFLHHAEFFFLGRVIVENSFLNRGRRWLVPIRGSVLLFCLKTQRC